jgi:pantoate--beta-alanine ligase
MPLTVIHTVAELDAWRESNPGKTVAFVPTMGALHEGHLSLVRQARTLADLVVVSIFVNPTQFGPNEDFDRYPRTLDADQAKLTGVADVVFAPDVDEVYPGGVASTAVPKQVAGPGSEMFEGASRPGHFNGMLTVVSRLFDIVRPDVAVFGQKDAQQVFLVRQMIAAQGRALEFVVAPTTREADGLALSSRNRYLSAEDRATALVMPHSIMAVAQAAPHAAAGEAREAGRRVFEQYPLAKLGYLDLVDPTTFQSVADDYRGPAICVVAAVVGTTHLIDTDNITLG